jgi:hypothetical protein
MDDIKARIIFEDAGASAALGKVTGAAVANATATKAASEAVKSAGTNVAQFGSTVGLVGQTVGRFNGSLGSVVSSAGAALGAVQAMTTAGLGPIGIAIGVVTTTIGLASAAFSIFKDRQNQAEASTRALNRALDDNAASLTSVIAKMRERDNLAEQRARLASGEGTSEEYRGQAEMARERLRLLQGEFGDSAQMDAARSRMMAEIRALEDRADAIERGGGNASEVTIEDGATLTGDAARTEYRRLHPTRTGGASGAGSSSADPSTTDTSEADSAARLAALTRAMDEEAAVRASAREDERAFQQSIAELEIQDLNDQKDRAIEVAQEQRDAIIEAKREEAEEITAIQQGVTDGFSLMNDVIALAAGTSEAAQKKAAQVMAATAMVEAVVQGALEVARAAASYPDVAGMVAHGTAAAAFGVAAVKAGMTMGGAGASGGGGGAPSAPTGGPSLSGGERERGGDTIVINWGSQGLVYAADRAQLGRDLEDMIGEGRSRLGRAA